MEALARFVEGGVLSSDCTSIRPTASDVIRQRLSSGVSRPEISRRSSTASTWIRGSRIMRWKARRRRVASMNRSETNAAIGARSATVSATRILRGRVTWHDSDRFGGTVRARESGQMRPESGVRCR